MYKTVGFVPLTKPDIFIDDSNFHLETTQFSSLLKGMEEKRFPYPVVAEFRQYAQMVQFTPLPFQNMQGIKAYNLPAFQKNKHRTSLPKKVSQAFF